MITSPEPGWRDDGLYVIRKIGKDGEPDCYFADPAKVLTKRGKVRKTVLVGGFGVRYPGNGASDFYPYRVVSIYRPAPKVLAGEG